MAPLPSENNMVAELRLRYQAETIGLTITVILCRLPLETPRAAVAPGTTNRFARPTHYRRFEPLFGTIRCRTDGLTATSPDHEIKSPEILGTLCASDS